MKFMEKFSLFLKKILKNSNTIKKIDEGQSKINMHSELDIQETLKPHVKEINKAKVETLICPGDGLGINNKIES